MYKRTKDEILIEIERLIDQIWYNRHQDLKQRVKDWEKIEPNIWKEILKNAKRIEKQYWKENLWYENDFEFGMLNWKLSALRWLIGGEWDMLDI